MSTSSSSWFWLLFRCTCPRLMTLADVPMSASPIQHMSLKSSAEDDVVSLFSTFICDATVYDDLLITIIKKIQNAVQEEKILRYSFAKEKAYLGRLGQGWWTNLSLACHATCHLDLPRHAGRSGSGRVFDPNICRCDVTRKIFPMSDTSRWRTEWWLSLCHGSCWNLLWERLPGFRRRRDNIPLFMFWPNMLVYSTRDWRGPGSYLVWRRTGTRGWTSI